MIQVINEVGHDDQGEICEPDSGRFLERVLDQIRREHVC